MHEDERQLLAVLIGHRIRECRKQHKMSQEQLSLGIVGQPMLSLIENGRQLPLPEVLELLAKKLEDETLLKYASQTTVTLEFFPSDHGTIATILRTHRATWHHAHFQMALRLCQFYYDMNNLDDLEEMSNFVINNSSIGTTEYTHASFFKGSVHLYRGDHNQAETWLRISEETHHNLSDLHRGRLYHSLGYIYLQMEVYGLATWYAKLAVDVFLQIHDFLRHGKALALLGTVHSRTGRLDDALTSLSLSLNILENWKGTEADVLRVKVTLADVYDSQGKVEDAEIWCQRALSAHVTVDDPVAKSSLYRILCNVHLSRNERERAGETLRLATEEANRCENGRSISLCNLMAAGIALRDEDRLKYCQLAFESSFNESLTAYGMAAECLATLHQKHGNGEEANKYQQIAMVTYRKLLERSTSQTSLKFLYILIQA
jgi:transcriptional regulator with XRE-family HTH domain